MAENTKIEWAHHTFNPWEGCQKVGPGCDNCYAEARNARFAGGSAPNWGPGAPRRRTSRANWRNPIRWNAEAERLGVRYRIFCASLADVYDNAVPASWRADLFQLIENTPHLDWLLLTKRIGNVGPMMLEVAKHLFWLDHLDCPILPDNVWLGATVVNQEEADRDIPKLLATPAHVRFLSMEPLLGPVDLTRVMRRSLNEDWVYCDDVLSGFRAHRCGGHTAPEYAVDWVIVGGESSPGARPMHPEWARSLRDQCEAASVPFLFKQWGEWAPRAGQLTGGSTNFQMLDPHCKLWPHITRLGVHGLDTRVTEHCTSDAGEDIYMQRVGRQRAGRHLDGQLHDGFPCVTKGRQHE